MTTRASPPWEHLVDDDSFVASPNVSTGNPLDYPGYEDALARARASTGYDEAVVTGAARIGGFDVEVAVFAFEVFGGSMGEAVGEQIARSMERAASRRVPFVLRTTTGGARMQEGMRALVQMPKVVAARLALTESQVPFVAILGNPTTGGVLASIGALADVTAAEEGATVGFAGPRVVEAFTGARPSDESHSAVSALRHGLVDEVVPRSDVRGYVKRVLSALRRDPQPVEPPLSAEAEAVPADAWAAVQAARSEGRTRAPHLLVAISDPSVQLRGDRAGSQDPAVVTSLANIAGHPLVALALDKKFTPGPGAFRKARRCVELAGRLGLPIVTLVDTKGADPSEASETGGIAWEIARLFEAMLRAPVPVLSIVTGEGGSGGALAFATADALLAYESSIFSVIAPEPAAEILWRDAGRAPDAARALKLTARDLVELGIADELLAGPFSAESLYRAVAYHLGRLERGPRGEALVRQRRARWRANLGGD